MATRIFRFRATEVCFTGGGAVFGWRDRTGKRLETMGQPVEARGDFSLSPDGSRVAYVATLGSGPGDVWVLELSSGLSTRITFSNGVFPRWSPDGKHPYYANPKGIHRKAADGSGEEELVMKGGQSDLVGSVSPDGKYLPYGLSDILALPLIGERKPEPYLQTKYTERRAAYESDESGRQEIYVQGFPERRGKWLISAEGGRRPEWRADGKELYWNGLDGTMMAASVELQAAALFRLPGQMNYFQPARDGRRFLVMEPEGEQQARPMVVVQKWVERLGK